MSPAGRHFGLLAAAPSKRPEDVVDCAPPPDAAERNDMGNERKSVMAMACQEDRRHGRLPARTITSSQNDQWQGGILYGER